MVSDYQYRNLFAEHFAVDYVIVDSGATVTASTGQPPTISGETFSLTNEDIKAESIKLNESLCSDRNLVFGKIESAKLSFSFKNNEDLPTDLTTQEIDVYLYFNNDSDTLFQVGRYTVNSDRYSENNFVRSITAYDLLYYIKDIDITDWYYGYFADGLTHKIIDILTDEESNDGKMGLFEYLSDVEGMPFVLASGQTLVNGDFMLGQTIESDSVSFEFFMQRILEFNGAFGHINRAGEFEFVVMEWYDAAPVRTVVNDDRIPPTEHDIVSTWGIGGIDVYDQNNIRLFKTRNTNKRKPSIYVIVDSFIFAGRQQGDSDVESALQELQRVINHYNYKSCNVKALGDLCVEVGDRINVSLLPDEGEERGWFRSYVLMRTFSGIQGMTDIYQANGDKKQPVYQIDNDRWHDGDTDAETVSGAGGISLYDSNVARWFVQIIRNIGLRLLDEPDNVSVVYNKQSGQVEIKWEDPVDITTFNPVPAEWTGTVVVRKEGSVPLHRYGGKWGGTLLTDSTTRDQYKINAFVDNTIEINKKYYYGIFPYSIALDDEDHPIRHYRFTKVISVDTNVYLTAPTIGEPVVDGLNVTLPYEVPTLEVGTYTTCKLVIKKGSIPASISDGTAVDIDPAETSVDLVLLDQESTYYFVIFVEDSNGNTAYSDSVSVVTGIDEGYNYEYTGEIQTFTAPQTGIYSLETWGAQGGNATDGTLIARGGYGAYAYGEVYLQEGDKLYINVGGQNGYGGGGNFDGIQSDFEDIARNIDFANAVQSTSTANIPQSSLNTEDNIYVDFTSAFLTDSYADGVITMQADRYADTYIMVPLNKHYNIKRIEFDAKITLTNQSNDTYNIGIRTCDCWDSDKSLHWSGLKTMGMYNNDGTYGFNIPDFDWNSYGYDVDLTANYLVFLARNVNPAQYKNIKVYVESL